MYSFNTYTFSDMMTSSNGNIFRVTGPLCGEFTGPGEFPAQRPVTRSFDVFFDLRPNKRLSKQPWGWWFETLPWSLWRHCNEIFIFLSPCCPSGFVSMTVPVYLAECAPTHLRGILLVTNNLCIAAGQFVSSLVDAAFSYDRETGWRYFNYLVNIS